MILNTAERAAIRSGRKRIGVFFHMRPHRSDPVRLWLGVGKIDVGVNVLDPSGAEYSGLGELGSAPEFEQLINGAATRVTFSISGVSGDVLNVAGKEARAVKNAPCRLGLAFFGPDWQLLGAVHWVLRAFGDFLSVEQQQTELGVIRTLSLSVGTSFTGRRRNAMSFYTDYDQQRRSPGDQFCERSVYYVQDIEKPWPRFEPPEEPPPEE